MIISASRRTDIPAYFAESFFGHLKSGAIIVANPFNPHHSRTVDLRLQAVDAIVFWTRYPGPLFKYLDDINTMGYDYVFLYTITGYPEILEPRNPDLTNAIDSFKYLSDRVGPDRITWRYDPVVVSNITDAHYHNENFRSLAKQLSRHTNHVIISFLDFYKKLGPRFRKLADEHNIIISDIMQTPQKAMELAANLKETAESYNLQIQSCAEDDLLRQSGIISGACIDCRYLAQVLDKPIDYPKDKNQRVACRCSESIDIGSYNTCRFGCIYCYAVR